MLDGRSEFERDTQPLDSFRGAQERLGEYTLPDDALAVVEAAEIEGEAAANRFRPVIDDADPDAVRKEFPTRAKVDVGCDETHVADTATDTSDTVIQDTDNNLRTNRHASKVAEAQQLVKAAFEIPLLASKESTANGGDEDIPEAVPTVSDDSGRKEGDHGGDDGNHFDGHTGNDEEDPWEANVSLASAMSHRFKVDGRLDSKAAHGYDRMDPRNPSVAAFTKGMEHGMAALFLIRIEDPAAPIDEHIARNLADSAITDEVIDALRSEWDVSQKDTPSRTSRLTDEQRAEARNRLRTTLGDALGMYAASGHLDQTYQEYERLLPRLQEVADEHGVRVADALRDDGLYTEAVRSTFGTAAQYANDRLSEGTTELFTRQATTIFSMTTVGRARIMDDPRSEVEILAAMQSAPDWNAKLVKGIQVAKEVYLDITADRIKRFWGAESLESLPQDIRNKLR